MEFTRVLSYRFPLIRGEDVRGVQQALLALHIQPSCGIADGVYGSMTAAAVKSFQGQHNVAGRESGAALAVSGEVDELTWAALFNRAVAVNAPAARIQAAGQALTYGGPISGGSVKPAPCLTPDKVRAVRDWMAGHFGPIINAVAPGNPVDADVVYAIACQETAASWLPWIDTMTPEEVLARCVFDASGDAPQTLRHAFPTNTDAFRAKFGSELTAQLIAEANATRMLRRLPPAQWVYKGYGIFQYDLQNILSDPDFFKNRQWSDFGACLNRLMREMQEKLAAAGGDLREALRRYNGAGPAAELYATNVLQMKEWCVGAPAQYA
jgi:Putative peptidoglycan binding domain